MTSSRLDSVTRYPLSWPVGWKRTIIRARARFASREVRDWGRQLQTLSVAQALTRLHGELDRLGAREIILSTNLITRSDGLPRSDQRAPADPGVAVYFTLHKKPTVLACDKWDRVADNLAAVAAHIDALRRIERYGIGTVEQAFRGYAALPASITEQPWRAILGFDNGPVTRQDVEARYRELARQHHPDAGGDSDMMASLSAARTQALQEIRL